MPSTKEEFKNIVKKRGKKKIKVYKHKKKL
jgi:hypothetical protein